MTIYNPYSAAASNRYAFGTINVEVAPNEGQNMYGSSTLTLSGFGNVEEFIAAMNTNLTVPTSAIGKVQMGYSVYLNGGGTTYLWQLGKEVFGIVLLQTNLI